MEPLKRKRRSGIPTGNAGEYFVMGELLRRGFDAQLADRNTKGYDLLVGRPDDNVPLSKIQVKTVRTSPWYVSKSQFEGEKNAVTIYVLLGDEQCKNPVQYFITKNRDVAEHYSTPESWGTTGFMNLKPLLAYKDCWQTVLT